MASSRPKPVFKISLPKGLEQFVNSQIASGAYRSASELVGEAIREKMRRAQAQDELERLLLEGLDSGEPIPFDEKMYDREKRELTRRLDNRKRTA